jgi:hypothetical protein
MTKEQRALAALYSAPVDLTSEDDFQALLDEIDEDLGMRTRGSRSVENRLAPDMILGEYGVAPADVLALASIEESIGFGAEPKPAPFKRVSDFFVRRLSDGSTKADQALDVADKKIAQARMVKARLEAIRKEVAPRTASVPPDPVPAPVPVPPDPVPAPVPVEPAAVVTAAPSTAPSSGMSGGLMVALGAVALLGVGVGVYAYSARR